jgi:branched-chain amino acid transport system permease protein
MPPAATAAEMMLPRKRVDYQPWYVLAVILALTWLWVGDSATWLTLTVAGLAVMLLFIMASGLTMVFGLMGVMNFGHGAFITVGAAATLVLLRLGDWLQADALLNAAAWGWRCWLPLP